MEWIDTHAHLYLKEFEEDLDAIVKDCKSKNISQVLLPNIDLESMAKMETLERTYPQFFKSMMGIHPCYVEADYQRQLAVVEGQLIKNQYFIAIGEIGIDLYWDKSLLKEQQLAFQKQIQLAKQYQLPIVIHARNSFDEIFEILDEENTSDLSGVLHCFTGNLDQAKKVINYGGFKLGIGGVLTFKNAGLDKVIKEIDVKHLILETDAPYLSPAPKRGKRNQSPYLLYIAQKLADIHNTTLEEIAKTTTKNAKDLFGLEG